MYAVRKLELRQCSCTDECKCKNMSVGTQHVCPNFISKEERKHRFGAPVISLSHNLLLPCPTFLIRYAEIWSPSKTFVQAKEKVFFALSCSLWVIRSIFLEDYLVDIHSPCYGPTNGIETHLLRQITYLVCHAAMPVQHKREIRIPQCCHKCEAIAVMS